MEKEEDVPCKMLLKENCERLERGGNEEFLLEVCWWELEISGTFST